MVGPVVYLFCILFVVGSISGDPVQVKLPSERLRYDRSKAKGPLIRGTIVRRAPLSVSNAANLMVIPQTETYPIDKVVPKILPPQPIKEDGPKVAVPQPTKAELPQCRVKLVYPYNKSPNIEIKGINGLFNSILVGYQDPESCDRENKGSLFGWSTTVDAESGRKVPFTFNLNYKPITPLLHPTPYCALILQPPFELNSEVLSAFNLPSRDVRRSLESTESFKRFLKDKNIKVVTSCCFVAHPREFRRRKT
ncbi:hypothetical protein protein, putative [Babesia ovis]|uniref:Uncharacterized protein n=1 Tax=Babesia ovis TaxID=5869 RepID=A0A9W5T9K6_BABOV|nr:hypothetical protein protein, putative [Babesia ovis]